MKYFPFCFCEYHMYSIYREVPIHKLVSARCEVIRQRWETSIHILVWTARHMQPALCTYIHVQNMKHTYKYRQCILPLCNPFLWVPVSEIDADNDGNTSSHHRCHQGSQSHTNTNESIVSWRSWRREVCWRSLSLCSFLLYSNAKMQFVNNCVHFMNQCM